jgi:alanine racemase
MSGYTKEELDERGHPVWAEIDLEALRHNIRTLDSLAGAAEVIGVVKGYAYGHGNPASAVAMLEGGATRLGVARLAEAIHLRQAGIDVPVHLFTEPPPQAVEGVVEADVTATVYTSSFARALSDAATTAGKVVPVHLKVDTGMHRVGLQPDDLDDAVEELRSLPGLELEGLWSHFAVADQPDDEFNSKQLDLFEGLSERVKARGVQIRFRHMANSAAVISQPASHFDLVRCGIASYGLWPGEELVGAADLRPVLSLKARANLVKEVVAGERLSYGLRYEMPKTGRVVTVPVGYADGYDRRLSGLADVLIGGRRHKVSGTVCMDQFMVDVGDADVSSGEVVTLIGVDGDQHISAEELAAQVGTINYEVTTRIPSRVPRLYLNERTGS